MELNNEELLLPQCRVFVDGRQIKASEEMIESVSVQLSASQMSNSCEVVIFCDHDHGRSTIGNIISRASAGKKIRVEMGFPGVHQRRRGQLLRGRRDSHAILPGRPWSPDGEHLP